MLIRIKELRLNTIIGTNPWERETPQQIVVNIEMTVDGKTSAASDDLNDAVDYANITEQIIQRAAEWKFFLLEKLATEILKIIINDERVLTASVETEKPAAVPDANGVSITVKYDRESGVIE
ncbi:MAG: dihydroneopterin aldolase [Phycisphaerae bacterium]|nr:dihydroneopterin aldolase [Phycisphaerae bacterium]